MDKSSSVLSTTGIQPATEFPRESYEIINTLVTTYSGSKPLAWHQFAGSWNAIGYRFKACAEHDEAFINSVMKNGTAPPQPERYFQERELFNFFITGLATLETFYYAMFAIASIIQPHHFLFSSSDDFRRVSSLFTVKQFDLYFEDEPFTIIIQSIRNSSEYSEWCEIRNILVHRTLPGRIHHLGGELDGTTLWHNGILIDANTTSKRRKWLSEVMAELMIPAAKFCQKYL